MPRVKPGGCCFKTTNLFINFTGMPGDGRTIHTSVYCVGALRATQADGCRFAEALRFCPDPSRFYSFAVTALQDQRMSALTAWERRRHIKSTEDTHRAKRED